MKTNNSISMGSHVIKKLQHFIFGLELLVGLGVGNVAASVENGGVNNSTIIKEAANKLVDEFHTLNIEGGRTVEGHGFLRLFSIYSCWWSKVVILMSCCLFMFVPNTILVSKN